MDTCAFCNKTEEDGEFVLENEYEDEEEVEDHTANAFVYPATMTIKPAHHDCLGKSLEGAAHQRPTLVANVIAELQERVRELEDTREDEDDNAVALEEVHNLAVQVDELTGIVKGLAETVQELLKDPSYPSKPRRRARARVTAARARATAPERSTAPAVARHERKAKTRANRRLREY
jgi:hypothetical protein